MKLIAVIFHRQTVHKIYICRVIINMAYLKFVRLLFLPHSAVFWFKCTFDARYDLNRGLKWFQRSNASRIRNDYINHESRTRSGANATSRSTKQYSKADPDCQSLSLETVPDAAIESPQCFDRFKIKWFPIQLLGFVSAEYRLFSYFSFPGEVLIFTKQWKSLPLVNQTVHYYYNVRESRLHGNFSDTKSAWVWHLSHYR